MLRYAIRSDSYCVTTWDQCVCGYKKLESSCDAYFTIDNY